jgi:uncharacterized membrane protein YedE/YeeE
VKEARSSRAKPASLAFLAGLLFGVGLAIGGMTQPAKVLAFLDVAGAWDPSLLFVMLGAIAVYFTANRFVASHRAPWTGGAFQLPSRRDIDARLVLGAALFGVGWGLGGYCPGPGITALASGSTAAFTFVVAMVAGMLLFEVLQRRRGVPEPESLPSQR